MAGNLEILSLLHNRFYAQEIISIHQKEWAWLFQEKSAIPDQFRNYLSSFQKAYLFSSHKPEILIRGLNRAGLEKVLWIPSLPDVEQGEPLQVLQRKILASQNISWIETGKYIFPSREDLLSARHALDRHLKKAKGKSLLAIHPGSGSPHKNWPLERFLETAEILWSRNLVQPVFLTGPVERDTGSLSIASIRTRDFPLISDLSLPVLAGVLSQCMGYLGNDSGVSHLAADLGLPTTVLFGPTDPFLWGPKGNTVKIIFPSVPCAPCTHETMRSCTTKECLTDLTVPKVLEGMKSLNPWSQ